MHPINVTNFSLSGAPTGGHFDFRIGRGSIDIANLEREGDAVPHHPVEVPKSPPALLETHTGHIVIHGHRQIDAAISNGLDSIPALVYPEDTPRQIVAALAIEQCTVAGPAASGKHDGILAGIEKILAIYKTSLYAADGLNAVSEPFQLDKPVSAPDWLVLLYAEGLIGRRVSGEYVEKICRALAFPESELLALKRFRFSIDQIASLLALSTKERAALIGIRSAVMLTTAETRQLVRLFVLSRGRAHFNIDMWAAAAQEEHTKGSAIIGSIVKEIHPTLTGRRRQIEKALREMRLPSRVRIKPPENLEGDSFSCYFRFSRIEELDGYVKLLGRVVQDGDAGRLLDLLNDDVSDTEAQ